MPQQEMSFEGSSYEQSREFPRHYSDQYSRSQVAQKLPQRALSKKMATRIQLWTAYTSLLLAMLLSFIIGGRGWDEGFFLNGIGIAPTGILLLFLYIIIIALNVLVFVLVNFKVSVTRKQHSGL